MAAKHIRSSADGVAPDWPGMSEVDGRGPAQGAHCRFMLTLMSQRAGLQFTLVLTRAGPRAWRSSRIASWISSRP